MLKELLELNDVTINISTTNSGQKNIVVMKKDETPLVLTGKKADHLLMEKEIIDYALIVEDIATSSNKDSISKATKATKETPTASPKATSTKVTQKPTVSKTELTESENREDENQLQLIDEFEHILSDFKM